MSYKLVQLTFSSVSSPSEFSWNRIHRTIIPTHTASIITRLGVRLLKKFFREFRSSGTRRKPDRKIIRLQTVAEICSIIMRV